ncbi:MAG: helix-turn-helix transcriptional regulator [Bacteroides sp.]|nr:helix-turn-helix transcriptional regulator [Bacteroides sp.]
MPISQFLVALIFMLVCVGSDVVAASVETYSGAGEIDYARFRRENVSREPVALMRDAWQSVSNERYDSAAAYYSLVASRFSDHLPLRDKRRCAIACVNMGYIWLAWRQNAAEAYPWLMRARELAQKYDFDDIETSVISNIGLIYFDYNNIPKAVELFKTVLERISSDPDGSHYYGRALIDFITSAMMADRLDVIKEMTDKDISVRIVDDEPLKDYVGRLKEALQEYTGGNHREAALIIEDATPLFDLNADRKRYLTMHHLIAAKMWIGAGVYDKVEYHCREVISISSEEGFFNFMEKGYAYLMECAERRGDREAMMVYRYRGMQIRDSLFNAARFETVKDLAIAGELNKLHEDVRESVRESMMQRRIIAGSVGAGVILALALVMLLVSHRRLKCAYREIYKSYMEHSSHEDLLPAVEDSQESHTELPGKSEGADDLKRNEILRKVKEVMEHRREILNPEFSVDYLAEMIGEKPKVVSNAINAISGKNFNVMLGEYRIREACRILSDPEKVKAMSMEGVAESVGYRSRTYFSKVFKDVTGLTPSQFARQAKEAANRS